MAQTSDQNKTQAQLIEELQELRRQAAALQEEVIERKQAEAALRGSEERYRTILENMEDSYYEVDLAGNLTFFNDSLSRLYGYSRDELLGMNYRQYMDDETAKEVYQTYNTVYRTGKPSTVFHWAAIRKDGTRRFVEVSVSLMHGATGEPVGFRGIVRDITERKQAEEETRAARQQLSDIIDFLPDATFVVDKDRKVIAWNRAAEEMTGTRKEDLLGQGDYAYAVPLWGERRPVVIDFLWSEDPEFMAKYPSIQKKGDSLYTEVFVPPMYGGKGAFLWATALPLLDSQGNRVGAIECMRDITRHKELEQQLQESLERRGRQVQISTEVAQEIAAVPALDELYRRVVTLIKDRFGYSHVQILSPDPELGAMVVVEGYGQVGEKMKAARHHLLYGQGMVGTAAATGQPILASDVSREPAWVPNPHLPDTQGELAVPIKLRDEVLGVLDVQSDVAGALTEEDQILLMGLAGQIAAAIQSTRLFEQAQDALREMEATQRRYLRQAWTEFLRTVAVTSYETGRPGTASLGDTVLAEIQQAVQRRGATVVTSNGAAGQGTSALVVPVALRGEIIGALGIHDDGSNRQWTDEEMALVEAVAERMAITAESLRLLEQTQRRAARDRLIGEVSTRIRETLDMDAVLRTATREIGDALKTSEVEVRLAEPAQVQAPTSPANGDSSSEVGGP